jgi:hypothetical protein
MLPVGVPTTQASTPYGSRESNPCKEPILRSTHPGALEGRSHATTRWTHGRITIRPFTPHPMPSPDRERENDHPTAQPLFQRQIRHRFFVEFNPKSGPVAQDHVAVLGDDAIAVQVCDIVQRA